MCVNIGIYIYIYIIPIYHVQCYHIVWSVEKKENEKLRGLQRQMQIIGSSAFIKF